MGIWIPGGYNNSESAGPCSWSDGTDEEIIEILAAHYSGEIDLHDYWSIGDERQVTLSAMSAAYTDESHAQQTVTFVLTHAGGKTLSDGITECAFQVDQKLPLNELGKMYTNSNAVSWKNAPRRSWCNTTYKNAIPSSIQSIFKQFINQTGKGQYYTSGIENTTDYFALRAEIEVFGSTTYSVSGEGTQVDWYKTSSNRIKIVPAYPSYEWWLRSPVPTNMGAMNFVRVDTSGNTSTGYSSSARASLAIAPFGVI